MPRRLPGLPNLEHLRKQAKELLRHLQRQRPHSKLADAQHAIAVGYGFANWTALKAHVEAVTAESPLVGTWTVNPSKSRQLPGDPCTPATLHIEVTGDTVTMTDVVVDAAGREARGVNTICADGRERASEHGYAVLAMLRGPRVLEIVVNKDGQQVSRLTYEVSTDGRSLTIDGSAAAHDGYPTSKQFSVLDRVSRDDAQ